MKLIIGLGNPGKEYDNTRHNIGFMVVDHYLNNAKFQTKYNALYHETNISGEKVIFIKPQTYMNLSGNSVIEFVRFYKIDIEDILVIQDDLDLDIGTYRIKTHSSSGGHNGIKSIINVLNSEDFARLKVGVSKKENIDTKDYVLGKFSKEELDILENLYPKFDKIINDFIENPISKVMNDNNGNILK